MTSDQPIEPVPRRTMVLGLIGLAILGLGWLILLPPVAGARPAAMDSERKNNTKEVGLASHNQYDASGRFFNSIRSDDGTELLSWRVPLLPYFGHAPLYHQFHLDEPWDSTRNQEFVPEMPWVYRGIVMSDDDHRTPILRPTGPGTAAALGPDITFRDITDGTSNTIAAINFAAQRSALWSKPEDALFSELDPLAMFRDLHDRPRPVLLKFDGSVYFMNPDIDPEVLRRLMNPQDGKPVAWPE